MHIYKHLDLVHFPIPCIVIVIISNKSCKYVILHFIAAECLWVTILLATMAIMLVYHLYPTPNSGGHPINCVGREDDVKKIKEYVHSSAIQVVHIVGPHAFGKATLAKKVSQELESEGIDVFVIEIDGLSTFESVSKQAMKVIDESKVFSDYRESLINWVSSRTSLTVLVFIKCDKWLEANNGNLEEIKNLQNRSTAVKYILTSRYRVIDINKFQLYKIGNLSDHAAHELLGKLTANSTMKLTQEHKVEIANLTGNHPLALEIVSALFNLPEPPLPEVLIEDLKTKLIETLQDHELSNEERLCVCIKVSIDFTNFTFPNLQILAQNLSHYPASFDERSVLEIVFNFSPMEVHQSSERKDICESQLEALEKQLFLKYYYSEPTKRYMFFHSMVKECFLHYDRHSINILFPSRFQQHYSQRLLDVSHSQEVEEDIHNFQHMFQLFSTSNCTFYYNTTLTAMQKTFEALTSNWLQQKFHSDIYNLTKCMMWFFDYCLNASCFDTVNAATFYAIYVKVVVAVSQQEEDRHASCEVLHLRAEIFEQAKELLTHEESYMDFTNRRDKCLMTCMDYFDQVSSVFIALYCYFLCYLLSLHLNIYFFRKFFLKPAKSMSIYKITTSVVCTVEYTMKNKCYIMLLFFAIL